MVGTFGEFSRNGWLITTRGARILPWGQAYLNHQKGHSGAGNFRSPNSVWSPSGREFCPGRAAPRISTGKSGGMKSGRKPRTIMFLRSTGSPASQELRNYLLACNALWWTPSTLDKNCKDQCAKDAVAFIQFMHRRVTGGVRIPGNEPGRPYRA